MELAIKSSIITQNVKIDRHSLQMKTLQEHAVVYGYDIASDVLADGDCFFHSVAYLLGRGVNTVESGALRRDLVSFLRTKVGYAKLYI